MHSFLDSNQYNMSKEKWFTESSEKCAVVVHVNDRKKKIERKSVKAWAVSLFIFPALLYEWCYALYCGVRFMYKNNNGTLSAPAYRLKTVREYIYANKIDSSEKATMKKRDVHKQQHFFTENFLKSFFYFFFIVDRSARIVFGAHFIFSLLYWDA